MPDAEALLSRSPPAADKYLPEWTNRNFHSGHLAETERLAAERLLQETQDLIQNARLLIMIFNSYLTLFDLPLSTPFFTVSLFHLSKIGGRPNKMKRR